MDLLNRIGMLLTIIEKLQGHPTLRNIRSHCTRELNKINEELEEVERKAEAERLEQEKKAAEEKKAAAEKEAAAAKEAA